MQGKTVLVSGGTSGIGEVAALRLAAQGARVLVIARDRTRGEATLARLRAAGPAAAHAVHYGDLSRIDETKSLAARIAASEGSIDVLINNVGALFATREVTAEGFERTFATNHLSYFVLSVLLMPQLQAAVTARVINVSSGMHQMAKFDIDDLQWVQRRYVGFHAYSQSKSCNILFTRELARRMTGTRVTVNALRPGFARTRLFRDMRSVGMRLSMLFAQSAQRGAATTVYLATSPEVSGITGRYFYRCQLSTPAPHVESEESARRLWEISAELTGVTR